MTAGLVLVGAASVLGYLRASGEDRGLTTEMALVVAYLLGVLAQHDPTVAAACGVAVTILLATRTSLHRLVANVLTDEEVHDALLLAASAILVLPLLPNRTVDPFHVLNPFHIWRLVVLLMSLSAAGYISIRALGTRLGLPIAGFLGGFVSSTATVAAMGARVRQEPAQANGAVAGTVLSSGATVLQLSVVLAAASWATLRAAVWPLVGAGIAVAAFSALGLVLANRAEPTAPERGRAFDLRMALGLGGLLTVATVGAALAARWYGPRGVIVAALLGGFGDVHASAIGVASLASAGRLSPADAVVPILGAFTTNTVSKIIVALSARQSRFIVPVLTGLALMIGGAWTGWYLSVR